jgi:hypothetical protein
MENLQIIQLLDKWCPDKAPTYELSPFEQGIVVGQRRLIDKLKYELKVEEPTEGLERK